MYMINSLIRSFKHGRMTKHEFIGSLFRLILVYQDDKNFWDWFINKLHEPDGGDGD